MQALHGATTTEAGREPVGGQGESTAAPAEPPVAAVAPMGPESSRGNPLDVSKPDASSGLVLTPSPGVLPGSSVPAVVPAVPAAAATAAPADAPVSDGLLAFQSTDASWVRVTDSRGATVFEKIIKPGSPLNATGKPPLTVVVGNARATTVQVRGQAFDLGAITRNNVARFEVK